MIRAVLALLAPLALTACASVQKPPEQYQTSRRASIEFMDKGQARAFCTTFTGTPAIACANQHLIWIENPCLHQGQSYADLLCHELAHVNAWPANHPR